MLKLLKRNALAIDMTSDTDPTCMCCMRLQAELSLCLQTEQVRTMGSGLVVLVPASLAAPASSVSSPVSGWPVRPDAVTLGEPTLA